MQYPRSLLFYSFVFGRGREWQRSENNKEKEEEGATNSEQQRNEEDKKEKEAISMSSYITRHEDIFHVNAIR